LPLVLGVFKAAPILWVQGVRFYLHQVVFGVVILSSIAQFATVVPYLSSVAGQTVVQGEQVTPSQKAP